jgi:hypothetical protein
MLDNKNIQKIFSLGDIRKKQLLGEVPERTRETYREYGYFGGGGGGFNGTTSISRIDFSNDTQNANLRGKLPSIIQFGGGCGNSNFGYFGAGTFQFQGESKIYRIDYANDGANASLRSNISGNINGTRTQATGNSNFGYWGGGRTQTSPFGSTSGVSRLNYATDTTNTSIRGPLTGSKYSSIALGNSNFGYFCGGVGPNLSGVDRIDYSNDSVLASRRGNLINGNQNSLATGNSNFGYINNDGSTVTQRIQYSSDTQTSINRGNTTYGANFKLATGNSNFGYFGGGSNQPGPIYRTIIDRIDYANDTATAQTRGPINYSTFTGGSAATSSHSFGGSPQSSFASNFTFPTVPNAGYFGGGTDGTNNLATIDKVDYANDTATASVRSSLSSAKNSISAIGNSNFGYFAGGISPGLTTVDRLEYSSDTQNTSTRTNLQTTLTQSTAVGNESFGYFSGANTQIQKIDYSNDSTSIVGNIDDTRQLNASTSTRNFGYFSAGDIPEVSIIQRINFSNDTANALFRTNHAFNRRQHGGVGNETYGYFGGGVIAGGFSTLVERLDYSNDTTQPNIRGPLSLPRRGYLGATGSQNFGYFSGGDVPGPTYFSTTDRINYSNDTAVASIRGPLSTAKGSGAASSPLAYGGAPIYFTNPLPEVLQKQIEFDDSNTLDLPFKRVLGSYGYFGGGLPNFSSIVSRLDFSNDTANAIQRGPLSNGLYRAGGCGNANFGYFGGGVLTGNPNRSTVDRIDYSNDISIASRRTTITARQGLSGVGNNNFGFFGGSYFQSILSLIERIDYSNDTSIGIRKGQLSSNRGRMAATGNSNFGYFGGGSSLSTVDRIDYSNDTQTASIRGPLSLARSGLAATGNSNFGYFGGGGSSLSTVDRIDYSNDTSTASVRGPLSSTQSENIATGNSNFGYFSVGSVSKINYSNDTATGLPRGNTLTSTRQTATTNARNS